MRRPEVGAAFQAVGPMSPVLGKNMVSLKKLQELGGLEDRDGWRRLGPLLGAGETLPASRPSSTFCDLTPVA